MIEKFYRIVLEASALNTRGLIRRSFTNVRENLRHKCYYCIDVISMRLSFKVLEGLVVYVIDRLGCFFLNREGKQSTTSAIDIHHVLIICWNIVELSIQFTMIYVVYRLTFHL